MATIFTKDISFHKFKTNTSQIDTFKYGTINYFQHTVKSRLE